MLQQLREEQDESRAKKWKGESFEDIQTQGVLEESGSEDVEGKPFYIYYFKG